MQAYFPLYSLVFITVLILAPLAASGKKIKQVHKMEMTKTANPGFMTEKKDSPKVPSDSLTKEKIRFSGYDKPASASKETFHITNDTDSTVRKIGIQLTYLDLENRMLHSREMETECNVPPGETRLVSIPSWDLQHTFFYYLGPEPKKTATPYKVKIELLWTAH